MSLVLTECRAIAMALASSRAIIAFVVGATCVLVFDFDEQPTAIVIRMMCQKVRMVSSGLTVDIRTAVRVLNAG